jgi:hypothetical protein
MFPLVLQYLDVKLSKTSSRLAISQGRLDMYRGVLKDCQSRYDGTDKGILIIEALLDRVRFEDRIQPTHKEIDLNGSSLSEEHDSFVSTWGDVVLRQPSCYLRLALAFNASICNGRVACDGDLPSIDSLWDRTTHSPIFPIVITSNVLSINSCKERAAVAEGQCYSFVAGTNLSEHAENNTWPKALSRTSSDDIESLILCSNSSVDQRSHSTVPLESLWSCDDFETILSACEFRASL